MAFAEDHPDVLPRSPKDSHQRLRFETFSVSSSPLPPPPSDFPLIDSKSIAHPAPDGIDRRSAPDNAHASSAPGLPTSSALPNSGKNSESPKPREAPREALNREMYRIPSYAGWFSWGKFHAIERRALNEFFDGRSLSKTPKIYKEYRDFIINKFRENPRRALTFTEVRKMLIGDVNSLRKVFDFLEYWGLINHQIAAESKQQTVATETSPVTMSETVPRGIRIVYPGSTFGPSRVVSPSVSVDTPVGLVQSSNLASHKDAFGGSPLDAPTAAAVEFSKPEKLSCSKCGADCTKRSFENSKKAEFVLCPSCFSALKASEGFSKDEFREKEANLDSQLNHENWTRQETLLLLEAISKHGEDWNRVASHVGTKSKAECIMHFIKLPFGDQFLNNVGAEHPDLTVTYGNMMDVRDNGRIVEQRESSMGVDQKVHAAVHGSNENMESSEDAAGPPLKRKRLTPFADASNPILAQVAFLSAMVGPRVAAAAAQAAVVALAEEDPLASQLVSSNNPSIQAGHKDPLPMTGVQATSNKENVKTEHVEKEDLVLGKGATEQMHLLKEAETETGNTIPSKDPIPSVTQIRAGIATAIGAVAVNAKLLADQEEREIEHLVASIIENQLKKLQSKVDHFEELEFLLEREHSQIEKARTQVLADWIRYSHYHYNTGPG